jgi:hypothetical protein
MSYLTINGFGVFDGKVIADSDDNVVEISKIFPKDTIISTQQNNSQQSRHFYDANYYIVGENNELKGYYYVTPEEKTKGLIALQLEDRRGRSDEPRRRSRSRSRSRSSGRSRGHDHGRSPSRSRHSNSRGGKRKSLKKRINKKKSTAKK